MDVSKILKDILYDTDFIQKKVGEEVLTIRVERKSEKEVYKVMYGFNKVSIVAHINIKELQEELTKAQDSCEEKDIIATYIHNFFEKVYFMVHKKKIKSDLHQIDVQQIKSKASRMNFEEGNTRFNLKVEGKKSTDPSVNDNEKIWSSNVIDSIEAMGITKVIPEVVTTKTVNIVDDEGRAVLKIDKNGIHKQVRIKY